ncbi:MAG TPA: CheR family methyltransferase [Polyangiaceae bacterium]|nr:CheR family methyltransferase [Polyangiaceae bacterium]
MIQSPSVDVGRFRAAIALRMGLSFDDGKLEFLAEVLERRLRAQGEIATRYLSELERRPDIKHELREIALELTVGETYFFRHSDQFRAFAEVALPARIEARSASRQLRLLSAGCSSGEEAYTLCMLTRERIQDFQPPFEVTIRGVDINPRAIERARAASYSSWALRETPEAIQKQHFTVVGRDHLLAKGIRESVVFEEHNLVADDTWAPESYDVIFCRNVLMYFTPENAQRVVKRFARALAPGGYLFLGHAENLRGLSLDFELRHTHSTFYYQRKPVFGPTLEAFETATALESSAVSESPPRAALALDWASTWLETVQRSSDRIHALTTKSAEPVRTVSTIPPASPQVELRHALELLSQERFAEALEVLPHTPSSKDPDAALLRAALFTHSGRLQEAELACAELLGIDGLNAGAHYLRSLCRERSADGRTAIEYSQIACYLDPSFAMPHLLWGLIARRTGDRSTALRELTQAVLLLQREDASRLLLFGGGFSREGLISLCQSELSRLGGKV